MRCSNLCLTLTLFFLTVPFRADGSAMVLPEAVPSPANAGIATELKAAWNVGLDAPDSKDLGSLEHVAWSPLGSCFVVDTPKGFTVLRGDGSQLWNHPFPASELGKRFRTLAVANSGQTVVLAGDSDDRRSGSSPTMGRMWVGCTLTKWVFLDMSGTSTSMIPRTP